ncbi:hypothetical protein HMPREF1544_02210 [Mucor circinelloides 1006PhL]|uniref:Uncharacterized protein n=1 Tax=Mucor circinelloides f. circinelloides (strain 1006PhL) TaxID=1220926 RepID=S2JKV4_MUCC1|nr:hypothetical protein HMPREF1544_02210 [Mucor circinelloides 1006PhL]
MLFENKYFPLNDQSQRDLYANVWSIIIEAFDSSSLTVRIEKATLASKEANN